MQQLISSSKKVEGVQSRVRVRRGRGEDHAKLEAEVEEDLKQAD